MGYDGMGYDGMGYDGIWDGMGWDGMGWNWKRDGKGKKINVRSASRPCKPRLARLFPWSALRFRPTNVMGWDGGMGWSRITCVTGDW